MYIEWFENEFCVINLIALLADENHSLTKARSKPSHMKEYCYRAFFGFCGECGSSQCVRNRYEYSEIEHRDHLKRKSLHINEY